MKVFFLFVILCISISMTECIFAPAQMPLSPQQAFGEDGSLYSTKVYQLIYEIWFIKSWVVDILAITFSGIAAIYTVKIYNHAIKSSS